MSLFWKKTLSKLLLLYEAKIDITENKFITFEEWFCSSDLMIIKEER